MDERPQYIIYPLSIVKRVLSLIQNFPKTRSSSLNINIEKCINLYKKCINVQLIYFLQESLL